MTRLPSGLRALGCAALHTLAIPHLRSSRLPIIIRHVVAGVFAFSLIGAGEVVVLADRFTGGSWLDVARAAAYVIGLCGVAGLVMGVAAAIVSPPLMAHFPLGRWWRTWRAPDTPAVALHDAAAKWLAVPVAGAALAAVNGLAGAVAHGFARPPLAGGFLAAIALPAAVAAIAVFCVAQVAFRRVLARVVPTGRAGRWSLPQLAAGVTVALIGVAASCALAEVDLHAWRWGGALALTLASVAAIALAARRGNRAPTIPSLLAVFAVVCLAGHAVATLDDAPLAARVLGHDGHSSRLITAALRGWMDLDGDGYSSALGGGDCDDANAEIGPHAFERPGNGVDDNCFGGDATQPWPKVSPPPASSLVPKRSNVVLIVIDALRPDHLGLHGYARATSPNLDAWADRAVVFERSYAQAPHTPRSLPSMLTGRYPSRVAWDARYASFSGMRPENDTLFEILGRRGWATAAVTAHWYFALARGIGDGVEDWDNRGAVPLADSDTQIVAPDVTRRAVAKLAELESAGRPYVLFVHYVEPHAAYVAHPSAPNWGDSRIARYDSEIHFVDRHIAPLLEAIRPANTIAIVTSDHGEAFGEHGYHNHGRTLYDEELRVPLIVRAPGVATRRIREPVGLVDLVPTIAALTGVEASAAQGRSLVAAMTIGDPALAFRPVFAEQLPYPMWPYRAVGVRIGSAKLVRHFTSNVTELFDTDSDPSERHNLIERDPTAGTELRAALAAFVDADPGP